MAIAYLHTQRHLFPAHICGEYVFYAEQFNVALIISESRILAQLLFKSSASSAGRLSSHVRGPALFDLQHSGGSTYSVRLEDFGLHNQGYGTLLVNVVLGILEEHAVIDRTNSFVNSTLCTNGDIKDNSRRFHFFQRFGFNIEPGGHYQLTARLDQLAPIKMRDHTTCGFPLFLRLANFTSKEAVYELPEITYSHLVKRAFAVGCIKRGLGQPSSMDYTGLLPGMAGIGYEFRVVASHGCAALNVDCDEWIIFCQQTGGMDKETRERFQANYFVKDGTEEQYQRKRAQIIDKLAVRVADHWRDIDLVAELYCQTLSTAERKRLASDVNGLVPFSDRNMIHLRLCTISGHSLAALPLSRQNVSSDGYVMNASYLAEIRQSLTARCRRADWWYGMKSKFLAVIARLLKYCGIKIHEGEQS